MAETIYKEPDEIFCPECGRTIKRGTSICPHCGVNIKELFTESVTYQTPIYRMEGGITPKNKTVAILLAVFFSFWTWLYTYGKNSKKFWISIGVNAVFFIIILFYSCSLISNSMSPYNQYYVDYTNFSSGPLIFLSIFMNLLSLGIWIWAIVDNSVKPNIYYEKYPKG
jgi:hypothetical protein